MPNDHGDADYDAKIIDKLGRVLDKTADGAAPRSTDADPLDRPVPATGSAPR